MPAWRVCLASPPRAPLIKLVRLCGVFFFSSVCLVFGFGFLLLIASEILWQRQQSELPLWVLVNEIVKPVARAEGRLPGAKKWERKIKAWCCCWWWRCQYQKDFRLNAKKYGQNMRKMFAWGIWRKSRESPLPNYTYLYYMYRHICMCQGCLYWKEYSINIE